MSPALRITTRGPLSAVGSTGRGAELAERGSAGLAATLLAIGYSIVPLPTMACCPATLVRNATNCCACAWRLLEWIENRDNMNTATNRDSRWLFPGRRAGQPMHPESLAALVNSLGIPTVAGRTSAIRQHVLEMPAPVVADALGYHPVTTAKLA